MNNPHEIQQKVCKDCQQLKDRIQYGTYKNPKHKRWIDNQGKQWNGHICPDCQKLRTQVNMKKLREAKKSNDVF